MNPFNNNLILWMVTFKEAERVPAIMEPNRESVLPKRGFLKQIT